MTLDVPSLAALDRAYEHCRKITRDNSHTVYLASLLLPYEKRRSFWALYAFARVSDDRSDDTAPDRHARWAEYCQSILDPAPDASADPVAVAWADARHRHHIPRALSERLLAGLGRDLDRVEIDTYDDLVQYAHGVGCPVPVMAMHIVGAQSEAALSYAVTLGVAVQLTNVLRDVGEDLRAGRRYLPREDLARFGVSEEELARGLVSDRFRALMRFQIERNRRVYSEALPGIHELAPAGRLTAALVADLYMGVLSDIEAHDHDVLHRRARVPDLDKLRRLPAVAYRTFVSGHERSP
ncbi:MAG: squalene/phytoene synthase family protein [Polyangiaceae bacterium]